MTVIVRMSKGVAPFEYTCDSCGDMWRKHEGGAPSGWETIHDLGGPHHVCPDPACGAHRSGVRRHLRLVDAEGGR